MRQYRSSSVYGVSPMTMKLIFLTRLNGDVIVGAVPCVSQLGIVGFEVGEPDDGYSVAGLSVGLVIKILTVVGAFVDATAVGVD